MPHAAPQWYAVINVVDGTAVSFATVVAGDDELRAAGLLAMRIDHQPGEGELWDPQTRAVVADPGYVAPLGPDDDPALVLERDPEFLAMSPAERARTRVLFRALRG